MDVGISKIFVAVRDAFSACRLPPRTFKDERDLRLALVAPSVAPSSSAQRHMVLRSRRKPSRVKRSSWR